MVPYDIAKALGRNKSSVTRLLGLKKATTMGRPVLLSDGQKDRLGKIVEEMVEKADADYEVTLPMIHRRSRLKCSERTVARALRAKGYWFFKLYEKMILTPDDIKDRHLWAKKYAGKSKAWWLKVVQIHLDNHHFRAPTTAKGRKILAKRRVRIVCRKIGVKKSSIKSCFVKPPPKLRINVGGKGVLKLGGVGGGKVLVWETIESGWCGDKAAEMYTDVITPALKKRFPGRTKFKILEDNDPTGNLSKKGIAAKVQK